MGDAVVAEQLGKTYGSVVALDGLDLVVPEGGITALLGPNGAGKSTAIRLFTTLLPPDRGRATVAGLDVVKDAAAVRKVISLTGQYAAVDENLTGAENLEMLGRLLHLGRRRSRERAAELLRRFDLVEAAGRRVKGYSGGMRRRLDLAASLITTPRVLFLDEPTTGLDARSRNVLWDSITALVSEGTTVLLTTQYLEEADRLADQIVVIDHGRVIAEGTADELKGRLAAERVEITVGAGADLTTARALLEPLGSGAVTVDAQRGVLGLPVADGVDALLEAVRRLRTAKITVLDAALRRPSLDEVFLALTDGADAPGSPAYDAEPAQ